MLTALRPHPNEKAMILFSFSLVRLECSFHLSILYFFVRGSMLLNLSLSVKLENIIPFCPPPFGASQAGLLPSVVCLDALIIQVNFIEVETVENGKIQAKYFLEIDLTL